MLLEAQGRKQKHDKHPASSIVAAEMRFTLGEKQVILEWFSNEINVRELPPGLAKRGELPPGLAKQLASRGTLPPGLRKKVTPLPEALEHRLPPPPDGAFRVILSGQVVLLGKKSGQIFDVIEDVFEIVS